jgi:hypothetical protein
MLEPHRRGRPPGANEPTTWCGWQENLAATRSENAGSAAPKSAQGVSGVMRCRSNDPPVEQWGA